MLRLISHTDEREIIAALHALGRDHVKKFVRQLMLYEDDPLLLEECADLVLAELEQRAMRRRPTP